MSTINKNLKSWLVSFMALSFIMAISLSSCSDKKKDSEASEDAANTEMMDTHDHSSEEAEHPAEEAEHPEHPSEGSEHPSEGGEHPSSSTDSTATEASEHPAN